MRLSLFTSLAFAIAASSSAIPDIGQDTSFNPAQSLKVKREIYDCAGAWDCYKQNVADCNDAVNNALMRNDDVNYGADGHVLSILALVLASLLTSLSV